jgi:hypothetical protein
MKCGILIESCSGGTTFGSSRQAGFHIRDTPAGKSSIADERVAVTLALNPRR